MRVCVSVTIFTAVLSKLHVRMESSLDDLLTILIYSVKRSRRVQVEFVSNYRADRLSKPSFLASYIGGKLACELKAADMSSPQAVIY